MVSRASIPFNKPYLTGKEINYLQEAVNSRKLSGDGPFSKKCQDFFEKKYGFKKTLLTTSCTDALEMAAILLDIKENDEIIAPSFTFPSTVNPFILRGAKIVFSDSCSFNPNMDVSMLESLITPQTKAIIPVHYAGFACEMDKIMELAKKHNLFVVEDAAQGIDSFYIDGDGKKRPLGSIGHLGTFSFHETKNIIAGEGGMLAINDERFIQRAETIREKGTNRAAFSKGEVAKYEWHDVGSSFLPSDLVAAFLYAQLESLEEIQEKRRSLWNSYYKKLEGLQQAEKIILPQVPPFSTNNAQNFFIVCRSQQERNSMIEYLKANNVAATFHYLPLHQSPFYSQKHGTRKLPNADLFSERILRLPFYIGLSEKDQQYIADKVIEFFKQ